MPWSTKVQIGVGEAFSVNGTKLKEGILADVAPTILKIMGLEQPVEMTGVPLF